MRNVAIVPVVRKNEDNFYVFGTAKKFSDNGFQVWFEDIHKGELATLFLKMQNLLLCWEATEPFSVPQKRR